jgi:hypothetical protein
MLARNGHLLYPKDGLMAGNGVQKRAKRGEKPQMTRKGKMYMQERKDLILVRLARLKAEIGKLGQSPDMTKSMATADRGRVKLMATLEVVAQGLAEKGLPSVDSVKAALEVCRDLGAAVPNIPPDARLTRRDWAKVSPDLAAEFDDLTDCLEQGKPDQQGELVQQIANKLWALVDDRSVANSRHKPADTDELRKAQGDYEGAVEQADKINKTNLGTGTDLNPRVTLESQGNVLRQARILRQVRARHGILS